MTKFASTSGMTFSEVRALVKHMCKQKGVRPNRDYTHEWNGEDGCASGVIATTEAGDRALRSALALTEKGRNVLDELSAPERP